MHGTVTVKVKAPDVETAIEKAFVKASKEPLDFELEDVHEVNKEAR